MNVKIFFSFKYSLYEVLGYERFYFKTCKHTAILSDDVMCYGPR